VQWDLLLWLYDGGAFLIAYINDDVYQSQRLPKASTIQEMLSSQLPQPEWQGLAWYWVVETKSGDLLWGHEGSDPGLQTMLYFRPTDKAGFILFANSN
jgi:hypothetical protein